MDGPPIAAGPSAGEPPRCPACGRGDLLLISVIRRDRGIWRAACCAGLYDRRRRRVVRRSCGWSGDADPGPDGSGRSALPAAASDLVS